MMRATVILAWLSLATAVVAEEGMWTVDNFPSDVVLDKYGARIDQAWLDQVQRATVRIEGGCTGSFVSPNGLVLTNHHCVSRCLTQMSTADNDVEANGFYASEPGDEVRCETEQLSVLVRVDEITAEVTEATAGFDEVEANEIRKQTLTRLEQRCEEESATQLACEAVTLYHGGQYFLYAYKRYEDVRMVFAPETDIANFGGDPDNFNFPRWCLDMAFLRAYENDRPAPTADYLPVRVEGPEIGEPVFVPGHPGGTSRLLTVSELEYSRNVVLPHSLARYFEFRGRLIQFGRRDDEAYRISQALLQRYENAIKVLRNRLQALLDDSLMRRKRAEEQELMQAVARDPEMQAAYGSAWREIAEAVDNYLQFRDEHLFIESGEAFNSDLFDYARKLLRASAERQKPNEDRFREFTEAALPQMEQRLLAARPIYADLEELKLSFSLDKMREFLGPDSAFVRQILGSDAPEAVAQRLVGGTRLADPEVRRQLWEGGAEAVAASQDPMILLAAAVDEPARALRKRYEDEVEAAMDDASERIARARFAILGTRRYPDATFTLRVSFGSVRGWRERGAEVYPFTVTRRLFERNTGVLPFRVPPSWLQTEAQLDPETRFNYVASTDVIGGNSGSPMVDADGRLVGLVFDGNIHAIGGNYWFDEAKNRTVAVHPAVMIESLDKVYGARRLLDEMTTDSRRGAR